MKLNKQIILLNGSSSAGKSTIAKALQVYIEVQQNEEYEIVSIDNFLKMSKEEVIYEDDVYEISPELCAKVRQLTEENRGVIIDHVITSGRIYEQLKDTVCPKRLWSIRVTCPLEIICQRELERKDRCLGSAEASYTYLFPKEGYDLEVDTHLMSPRECAQIIYERIF